MERTAAASCEGVRSERAAAAQPAFLGM